MKLDLAAESLAALLTRALLDEAADHYATCTALTSVLEHIGKDALSTGIATVGDLFDKASNAARNRYADYNRHPRLGHEPLVFEARAAQISYNKAAAALAGGCDLFAWPRFLAAEARLRAIVLALNDLSIALPPVPRAKRSKTRPSCERLQAHHFSKAAQAAIAKVALGDRDQGLADLKQFKGKEDDKDGKIAKLLIAAEDETLVSDLNKLAREIQKLALSGGTLPKEAEEVASAPEAAGPISVAAGEPTSATLPDKGGTLLIQDIGLNYDPGARRGRGDRRSFSARAHSAAQNSGGAR